LTASACNIKVTSRCTINADFSIPYRSSNWTRLTDSSHRVFVRKVRRAIAGKGYRVPDSSNTAINTLFSGWVEVARGKAVTFSFNSVKQKSRWATFAFFSIGVVVSLRRATLTFMYRLVPEHRRFAIHAADFASHEG
jgi:hypothetical protein